MSDIYLDTRQLRKILLDVYRRGARDVMEQLGIRNRYISQNQANKLYGRGRVKEWIDEGLVTPRKDGDGNKTIRLSVAELDIAAATNRYKTSEEHPK